MFLDKNKDQLSNDLIECMGGSRNSFIADLFKSDAKYADILGKGDVHSSPEKPVGGKKKKYSVSSEFKDQLASLMDIVDTTEPHFIRCIKPNPQNEPDRYDRKAVTEQLRYGGVLQVVQVSRAGYPVRVNHKEAWDDYRIVASQNVEKGLRHLDDDKLRVQKLLEHLNKELNIPMSGHGLNSWAVGKTLVFFKQTAFERLKFARLELLIRGATVIQANWRGKVRRQKYRAIRIFTRHLQALLLSKEARMGFLKFRQQQAAIKIQARQRGHATRKNFNSTLSRVVRIQSWRRGILGRRKAKEYKLYVSARKIQRAWRRSQEQKVYEALKKTIYIAQQRWRMHHAKQQLKKLKQEAKEVGALMAKSQKAQEQVAELRKKNEDFEAQHLQAMSQKKNLEEKVRGLEEIVQELQKHKEESKVQLEEAARIAADTSKVMVDAEGLEKMKLELEEKEKELTAVKEELADMKTNFEKQKDSLAQSEARYQQLLKSTAMQSMVNLGGPTGTAPTAGATRASTATTSSRGRAATNRNVDIQLVGSQGVGKSMLLETLIKEKDPEQMQRFQEQKPNLMSHHQINVDSRILKVLDCSGNVRAQHLVKEWFGRSHWVFVVYDMSNSKTLDYALELMKEVHAAGARVILFGNKWAADNGNPVQVDITVAKDNAIRNEGLALESATLIDAVRMCVNAIEEGAQEGAEGGVDPMSPDVQRRSSISAAIDSVKSWFGAAPDRIGGRPANAGVLRPSLKGTKQMKQARREGDINADLRPVQELQDSESAVTCISFGQERLHKAYVLLATASKDGTVVIYRCYRTEMEIAMLSETDIQQEDDPAFASPPADHSNIAVHSRLVGHSRAITSIFFNLLEDQLVTTSIDKSVRFWGVDSGEMLKVFTDSSPVPVAAFLPFNPQVFVAANSNAVLRLVNVQNGMVLQKLKVETEVRALKFDDTGLFLLAGTKNGSIHVLEASDSSTLKFKFKVQLARGGVTCIAFVPALYGQPPCLLVNTSDSSATIIDCTYGPPPGVLTNLAVRQRVRVAHSLLPLKCCYSPSGQGYLISGSEDKEVYIYSLAKGSNYKMQYLKHHQVPVVAVAVNLQDSLLASADSLGRIVLWRRMDYSHLAE